MTKTNEQRQSASESYTARIQRARNLAIEHCADFFATSGVEYSCLKDVHDTVAPELRRIAGFDEYEPYNVNTPRTFRRIGDLVHARWQASTKGCPGHVARYDNPKVCRLCGTHVDEMRD